ncbi:MAG: hypothetical protein CMJ19_23565 [Phycisphaeraceae bacterium]|nr:hypothetical protein [Phycisphaeraceae bacterium]
MHNLQTTPRLITITGPSQAGKSTAIEIFKHHKNTYFKPVSIPKYTTRPPRPDDRPEEVIHVKKLPNKLDLVYQQYDYRYGLSSNEILNQLRNGYSPIIVLNDVRLITEVKRLFGTLVLSLFLYRKTPQIKEFFLDAINRGDENTEELEKRFKKAYAIYRIYIENIYLFDSVLINMGNFETLSNQIRCIVHNLDGKSEELYDE